MTALFIDVDNNLTVMPIQAVVAGALGCSGDYLRLETSFQNNEITSQQFGTAIVSLFRDHGFAQGAAIEIFDSVKLQPWVEEVLGLPIHIYLVSSGPSYYIERLAREYGIPRERVLCSQYEFDDSGHAQLIVRCSRPVSAETKASYVSTKQQQYRLTIGVGDSELHDGPFLSHCSLPILTTPSDHYFQVSSFDSIVNFVRRIHPRTDELRRTRPAAFVGCSSETLCVAEALQRELTDLMEVTIWSQGLVLPSQTTIEGLEKSLDLYDFAMFVLSLDDLTTSRGATSPSIRDNVLLELGMFVGRIGRERCFMLRPSSAGSRMPSDLGGMQYLEYDDQRTDRNWRAAVGPCIADMRGAAQKLGRRLLEV